MNTAVDGSWRLLAACRGYDPEMWSLSVGRSGPIYQRAHQICEDCPVRVECGEFAERTGSWGMIFGGRDFYESRSRATKQEERCTRCGTRFAREVATQRFCSDSCRKLHHARLRTWTSDKQSGAGGGGAGSPTTRGGGDG